MTELTAGYVSAIVAILLAASVALTIIRQVGGLNSKDESHETPSRDETIRRNVA
jgi:hypothetical protein